MSEQNSLYVEDPTEEMMVEDHYGQESKDILSDRPGVIIRWGITVVFFVVGVLIFVSWLIKYPDIINTRITILTQTPPIVVVAQTPGKITRLFVKEGQFCLRKSRLALIENTAKFEDIMQVKGKLRTMYRVGVAKEGAQKVIFSYNLQLGELQIDYHDFLQHYSNYLSFNKDNTYDVKVMTLQKQIAYHQKMKDKQGKQLTILEEQLKLSKDQYTKLLDLGQSISDGELMNYRSSYLQNEYNLEKTRIDTINNDITIAEYTKRIADLKQEYREKKRQHVLLLRESYKKLQSKVAWWEQKYILKAPIDGNVSLFKFWSPYQVVNTGDEVMTIIPRSYKIIGRVLLPQLRSGKVKVGQRVNIKLDSYPFHEYGFLVGEIKTISSISKDSKYLLEISFPKGFTTSYHKKIDFKQEMQGSADIITEDLRLMDRMFYQIRNAIKVSM